MLLMHCLCTLMLYVVGLYQLAQSVSSLSWPVVTGSLGPGPSHDLYTGPPAPAATTTLLQQQDVNTLAPSLDSHHPPLVPATTATTQPPHPAYACTYSQPALGVHSTATALVHQQPTSTVYSQPSSTQSVYTQPLLCQSPASMTTATQGLFSHLCL